MAEYSYVAIDRFGKNVRGTIQAKDIERVKTKLKNDGLTLVDIREANLFNRDIAITLNKKIKPRELSIYCRQLASILNAGVNISEALEMLADQTENPVLRAGTETARTAVEQGEPFAAALRLSPKIFPSMMIYMVEAGEATGNIDGALERMAIQFDKNDRLQRMINKAMNYPKVLVFVTIGVLLVMALYVIPQFEETFATLGAELPGLTKAVMAFSRFIIDRWYIALIIIVAAIIGVKLAKRTKGGEKFFDTLKFKIPVLGPFFRKSYAARFCRTLATLVSAGLPITTALEIAGKTIDNVVYAEAIGHCKSEVEQGVSVSIPLKRCGLFPPMVHQMIKIGEDTGRLEEMLEKVAEYYELEVEVATDTLSTILEPLVIVAMGVIIGIIVVALYLPLIGTYSELENL